MADVPEYIMEAAIAVHEAMMRADIEDEPLILARALLSERERRTAQGVIMGVDLAADASMSAEVCLRILPGGQQEILCIRQLDTDGNVRLQIGSMPAPSLSTSAGGGE